MHNDLFLNPPIRTAQDHRKFPCQVRKLTIVKNIITKQYILTNKGRCSYVSILNGLSLNRFANMQTTHSTLFALISAHDFQREHFLPLLQLFILKILKITALYDHEYPCQPK